MATGADIRAANAGAMEATSNQKVKLLISTQN
jgi:hypothetical protein